MDTKTNGWNIKWLVMHLKLERVKNIHVLYLSYIFELIISEDWLCHVCQKHSGGSGKRCGWALWCSLEGSLFCNTGKDRNNNTDRLKNKKHNIVTKRWSGVPRNVTSQLPHPQWSNFRKTFFNLNYCYYYYCFLVVKTKHLVNHFINLFPFIWRAR